MAATERVLAYQAVDLLVRATEKLWEARLEWEKARGKVDQILNAAFPNEPAR